MKRILLITTPFFLFACTVDTGLGNTGGPVEAPRNLVYRTAPFTYSVDVTIEDDFPSWEGGTPTKFEVAPELPVGVKIDKDTGAIGGRPVEVSAKRAYVVTASNGAGSATGAFDLTVSGAAVAPSGLTYLQANVAYVRNMAIPPNTAILAAGSTPVTYRASPDLPAGLSIDSATGTITGSPTTTQPAQTYTITATNSAGSTTATLQIAITATLMPPQLTGYTTAPAQYFQGVAITNNAPILSGGAASSFSINPNAPAGLTFNLTNGLLTGTPAGTQAATNYVITATNAAGNSTFTLSIQVGVPTVPTLSYTASATYCTPGTHIQPAAPSGSTVGVTFSIDTSGPKLPSGVIINPTTGVISGAPIGLSAVGPFVFRAQSGAAVSTGPVNISFVTAPAPTETVLLTVYPGSPGKVAGPTGMTNRTIDVRETVRWQLGGDKSDTWNTIVGVTGSVGAVNSDTLSATATPDETYDMCFNTTGAFAWGIHHTGNGPEVNATGTITVTP